VLAPHLGRIFLDQVSEDRWQLTDIVTHEKRALSGTWQLYFDDETGRAALIEQVEGADDRVSLVEDMMKFDVGMCKDGECYLLQASAIGPKHRSLDMMRSRFVQATVTIKVGSMLAGLAFETYVMKRPRQCRMSVFWDTHRLYNLLGLRCFGGSAWRKGGSRHRWA
jgi:hypothetical protein